MFFFGRWLNRLAFLNPYTCRVVGVEFQGIGGCMHDGDTAISQCMRDFVHARGHLVDSLAGPSGPVLVPDVAQQQGCPLARQFDVLLEHLPVGALSGIALQLLRTATDRYDASHQNVPVTSMVLLADESLLTVELAIRSCSFS